jgi:hypothetical protein
VTPFHHLPEDSHTIARSEHGPLRHLAATAADGFGGGYLQQFPADRDAAPRENETQRADNIVIGWLPGFVRACTHKCQRSRRRLPGDNRTSQSHVESVENDPERSRAAFYGEGVGRRYALASSQIQALPAVAATSLDG